jgi:hypothetical protein
MTLDEIKQLISTDYLSLTSDDILDFQNLSRSEFIQVNKAITTAMRKQSGIIQSSQEYIVIFPKDKKSDNSKNRYYQDALAHHAQKINSSLFTTLSDEFTDEEIVLAISKQKDKIAPSDSLKKALDSLKDFFNPEKLIADLGSSSGTEEQFLHLIKDRKNIRDTLVLSLTNTIRKLSNKIKNDEEKKVAAYKSLSDYLIRYINEIGFDPEGKTFDSSKASFLTKMTKDLMLQFIKPTSVEEDLYYANKCLMLINKDMTYDGDSIIASESVDFINNFTLTLNQDPTFINSKGHIKSDFLKFVMLKFAGFVKKNPDQLMHFKSHLSTFNNVLNQAKSEAEAKLAEIHSVSKTVSLTNDEGVNVIENQPSGEKPFDEQNQSSDHVIYIDFIIRATNKYSDEVISSFISSFDQSIQQKTEITENDAKFYSVNQNATGDNVYTLSNQASATITKDIYATQIKISKKIHKMIQKHGMEKFNEAISENKDLGLEYDIYNLFIESTALKVELMMSENKMDVLQLHEAGLLSKNEILICFPDLLPAKAVNSKKNDLNNQL